MSSLEVFERCYSQLTQRFINKNSKTYKSVRSGQDPIKVCESILDNAKFSKVGLTEIDRRNPDAVAMLDTMHALHYSWFSVKEFREIEVRAMRNVAAVFDLSSPALYYTKALFHPTYKVRDMFKGKNQLTTSRSNNNNTTSPFEGTKQAISIFKSVQYAPRGALYGVRALPPQNAKYKYTSKKNPANKVVSGSVALLNPYGGGVIGSTPYLLQNILEQSRFVSDGAIKSTRKWGKAILADFMCRSMPVARIQDVKKYVNTKSSLGYRLSSSCVVCHATMDQMGGLTRNFRYKIVGQYYTKGYMAFNDKVKQSRSVANIFPIHSDKDYSKRPPTGHFLYRTYDGKLINEPLPNVESLGNILGESNDVYVCLAKRYYQYFLGIDANIDDINDPSHLKLNAKELKYRNIVIKLGLELKKHQNPMTLIKDIINRPEYRVSDFNVGD